MAHKRKDSAFKWAKYAGSVMPMCPFHLRETGAESIKGDGVYICGVCSPEKAVIVALATT